MSVALISEYWAYHHWANRKLFEVTAALGEEAAERPVGPQFSEPTLRAMLVHIYGAERFWLETWRGRPPAVEIGRASGRGRGEISVVAVSLKKTHAHVPQGPVRDGAETARVGSV